MNLPPLSPFRPFSFLSPSYILSPPQPQRPSSPSHTNIPPPVPFLPLAHVFLLRRTSAQDPAPPNGASQWLKHPGWGKRKVCLGIEEDSKTCEPHSSSPSFFSSSSSSSPLLPSPAFSRPIDRIHKFHCFHRFHRFHRVRGSACSPVSTHSAHSTFRRLHIFHGDRTFASVPMFIISTVFMDSTHIPQIIMTMFLFKNIGEC